jgi:hypothetical protein
MSGGIFCWSICFSAVFLPLIMCSFAGFIQANFLQAAVGYKKKIGFNGNYNVATWFIRSHFSFFSIFDTVQYFNCINLGINKYWAFILFLYRNIVDWAWTTRTYKTPVSLLLRNKLAELQDSEALLTFVFFCGQVWLGCGNYILLSSEAWSYR